MKDQDRVFPDPEYPSLSPGLAKRELFAAMALQGLLASNVSLKRDGMAEYAVACAESLLAELEKGEGT